VKALPVSERKARAVARVRAWRIANPEKAKAARLTEDKAKKRARSAESAARNPESIRASRAKWRAANVEKRRRQDWEYRQKNKAAQTTYAATWRAANPDASRAIVRNRRARIKACEGTHTAADIQELIASQGGKCAFCRTSIIKRRHVDHIMPLALGGPNNKRNLQILCRTCNQRKGAFHPLVFAQREGRLL